MTTTFCMRWQDLVSGLAPDVRKRLLWYSSKVVLSYEATKNDPNKRVQLGFALSAKIAAQLDDLQKIFNVKSKQAAIERLISDAHKKNFLK
jgi:mannitol/fructose-specific phosphotransferase system IIA component